MCGRMSMEVLLIPIVRKHRVYLGAVHVCLGFTAMNRGLLLIFLHICPLKIYFFSGSLELEYGGNHDLPLEA